MMGLRGPKPTTETPRGQQVRLSLPLAGAERAALEALMARWSCSAAAAARRAILEAAAQNGEGA